ncbi:MAG TPA: DUF2231 domain-containing protein [Gemmatimonadaceae bacterium]|nr:DUF2231 domain-containing protein [Gemmatimonadaceae bacterium]
MRSKASFRGHPIHPAIIPFPFAFLTGAFFFDVAGVATARDSLWITGGHLAIAGIGAAILAAVPGLIDYIHTVPPGSTGKQRATRHMIVNLASVGLMVFASVARRGMVDGPNTFVLVLELGALVLLTAGGWMGGVLVSRNQISVDHRYAGAGKWKDATIAAPVNAPLVVARDDELKVDQMKLLRVGDQRIVLARSEEGYVAFDDRCPHRGGSLAGGSMMCGTVQCPWHGSQFDVTSGAMKAGPADRGISAYKVEAVNGEVRLLL